MYTNNNPIVKTAYSVVDDGQLVDNTNQIKDKLSLDVQQHLSSYQLLWMNQLTLSEFVLNSLFTITDSSSTNILFE
ncbi:hypothetical protein P344_07170 [Spiroplasma mirum ATCC 29335]|uniref:Uncharacterized protein n=1 Tax=Spiroplasma mirum ATCC 29335 TaxID=838561 RepID=W0GSL5_9MOLU|nr:MULTISPECIES: hypothetical protein [Spiroplasma]AHF61571.1 hypothetical protein SMM_1204 [Spiroplasma mirum ATCC 29335]AHI58730.1 hypothetical protein P344_07170 [Spiroplasma mirum ATCC 29335]